MASLIDINEYPVKDVLEILLKDKTTKKNIVFATDQYARPHEATGEKNQITIQCLRGFENCVIQPRVLKSLEEQAQRTRKNAEVFTPSWIVNKMNNFCDEEWFGRKDVFNVENEQSWSTTTEPITFDKKRTWKKYVDSRRLEITCGEAPYIVSRYDAATGEVIPVPDRIGILDRKLRVINENAADENEWIGWVIRAYQSVYGYEFQGDNLLVARVNLLCTFTDYMDYKWHRQATVNELRKIANIISWNFWQMNGFTGNVPVEPKEILDYEQITFDVSVGIDDEKYLLGDTISNSKQDTHTEATIKFWRSHSLWIQKYNRIKEKSVNNMKFDFVIGNPPYQDNTLGENDTFAPPIYNAFMDAAYEVSDKVELIHPARFLFNAGSTPKAWNQKMLNDEHFKVLYYEQDSSKVFSNTDIKGGVAVTYHDNTQNFGAIETFTPYLELNAILKKALNFADFKSMSEIVITRTAYRLTDKMHADHPEALSQLSKGHAYDMSTNIFDRLPQVFYDEKPNDGQEYIQILGRENNSRVYKYIRKDYVNSPINLLKYKVLMPSANGNGQLGETLSAPVVCSPNIGGTETFIGIGLCENMFEAEAVLSYIKTKFTRALLGILKITQHITPEKWKYVPLQNFTPESDIDWSVSIADIDKQLYKKYGLSQEEIEFIETNVKPME